ncbi:MAG: NAD(P)-dependent glycerol-1-phosphate dehydrogenase [Candidatus Methanoplasma sp.]|jgi:glycerol-1-phosphate dehydrogenase [NAD(P)+]|nr:NAD(P)-dependent glycerol-1-phosphate dehydrogenase [Candidatus Methanoplasma sp.]
MELDEFTKFKKMDFPRSVMLGHDAILHTVDLCRSLHFGKTGIIITGKSTYCAAGKDVEDLVSEKYDVTVVNTGNATIDNVNSVCSAIKEQKAKFILAVGGGSKIDIAKLAAKNANVPYVSIPTSVAHDGIASDRASLKSDKGAVSMSAVSPTGLIADTKIINEAPYRYLASGCADVISNLTALMDWELARSQRNEEFSSSAYFLARYAADNLIDNSKQIKDGGEERVWRVMRPVIASGISMCAAGSSRPTSGSEHMFSHVLDMNHLGTGLHGEQCGVGSIMMMYLHGGDWRRIQEALWNIGAPITASDIGLTDDEVIEALMESHSIRPDRYTILGEGGLSKKTATSVAKKTGVIGTHKPPKAHGQRGKSKIDSED